jgi:fumarate hydratase class II
VARLAAQLHAPFVVSPDRFAALSTQDGPLAVSAQLRGLAAVLLKIANDLRWMNSGPVAGLAEVRLAPLQPGSSIMPGKVNPVIAEAVAMIAAQVIGNDATISVAAQSGNFQLNVMQPLVAHALLQSIELLAAGCRHLAEKCVAQMQYNEDHLHAGLSRNPMLATALAPLLGYELAAEIAKQAGTSGRPVIEIAAERCSLSRVELERALDPLRMARGGLL